jgi:glycosyltransferase involved in cell wall biosynthesis
VLTNAELRWRMGRAARARAETEFTVARMIDRVYAEYEGLLKH